MATLSSSRQKALLRKYARNVKFLMMVVSICLIVYSLPKQAKFSYEIEKGKIWNQKDLISPYNFAILKTPAEIQNDRKNALANTTQLYQLNTEVAQQQIDGFKTDLEIKWHNAGIDDRKKAKYILTGSNLLAAVYDKGVLNLNSKYSKNQNYPITILEKNVATEKNTAELFTREGALANCSEILSNRSDVDRTFLLDLLQNRIQINVSYDDKLTNRLEAEVLEGLSLTRGMVQKGDVIISKGSVVNDDVYQKLESYKKAFEDNARTKGNPKLVLAGQFLLVSITIALLMIFLYLFRKDIYADNRLVSLILLVITAMLFTLSMAIKWQIPTNLYFIPYCIVPIIIRILFDTRLALNIHLLVVLIAGFFVPNSFEFAYFEITAGMVSIYSIKNLVRREQFLISAVIITFTYFVAFLGISLIREGTLIDIDWVNFIPFVVSVLLTLLAYPLIYLFEKIFAITSDITLIELTNTNAPLLREMAFTAPGTFQHSLQVANLAENAIYAIGGNALLVRAGALYHDIGKMENPLFFIENQNSGFNPHDKLPYEESAQIIIRHVYKGIEMAEKANIPDIVIDFIRTHHGNTRVDYFYQSYLKNFPEKIINENTFRYPGPIPFSKEAGVLMLADSVEAASRSLKEPDEKSISALVDRIVKYKLDQNQLKDSNITLKDLETIKAIFKRMLMSIYHVRIDY
jgi:putative nucleotidyltransferase with HDIG domain